MFKPGDLIKLAEKWRPFFTTAGTLPLSKDNMLTTPKYKQVLIDGKHLVDQVAEVVAIEKRGHTYDDRFLTWFPSLKLYCLFAESYWELYNK